VAKLPLGGKSTDYDSKHSRGKLINMIGEADKDKNYRTIKRCDGLTSFATGSGATRSNFLVNDGHAYFISGTLLYRVDTLGVAVSLGSVGGIGEGQILSNSVPGNNQILVLNGAGAGYIYDNTGLTKISDSDFFSTTSGAVLDERFWFIRDGTNEFFGSDISDGFSYNPLTFATAEESPDLGVGILSKGSSLWIGGTNTFEFWQSFTDTTLPVRKVRGGTIERGIKAKSSLAELDNMFMFLADDLTVRMISGNSNQEVSDLDFNLRVRGNGTATMPGFIRTDNAIGFFVDSPTHKIYYLTFPSQGYTWGYDLATGLSHTRTSEGLNYWRAKYAVKFNGKIIMGDHLTADIWTLDPDAKAEGSDLLRTTLTTPGISFAYDITIPLIELDMEVGQIEDPTISPMMMVRYTKDGGYNWVNHSPISLGDIGVYRKRVPLRHFGRLVRHKDFQLELTVTDGVRVQFYGAEMPMSASI